MPPSGARPPRTDRRGPPSSRVPGGPRGNDSDKRPGDGGRVRRVDFDPLAALYDRTRTLDPTAASLALAYICARIPPAENARALELGIGTGRFAFPFAACGYSVAGVDLSRGMLRQLRARKRGTPSSRVEAIRAEARVLPFPDRTFDLVYWVHVLHLIPNWRRALDEALRVVRPGGYLIELSTDGGRNIPSLSRQYDRLVRETGYRRRRLGVRRRATVLRYLAERGCRRLGPLRRWTWSERVSVGEALEFLGARPYSSMRELPVSVHGTIMRRLRAWAAETLGDPRTELEVPGAVQVTIHRAPRAASRGSHRAPVPRTGHQMT